MNDISKHPVRRNPALLLLGPTGSGKTPLGQQIETRGLGGVRCLHFDFGANLRAVVGNAHPTAFSTEEIEFLRDVLDTGALLEDERFPLAERILRTFLDSHGADDATCIVLNGLPRHVGQARAIRRIVDVRDVVLLECPPATVLRRIETNVGGDRTRRTDDAPAAVARKLALFAERTAPLVDHYRRAGGRVHVITVALEMTPKQVWQALGNREQ